MEQQTMTRQAQSGSAPTAGGPVGSTRMQRRYLDDSGRYRTAREPVPVDEFGRLAGRPFRCRRCTEVRWMPSGRLRAGGPPPMCPVHERPMSPASPRGAALLPWPAVWAAVERPLRPVWVLPALAGAGVAVDAGNVPALAVAAGVPVVGEVARRLVRRDRTARLVRRGSLDADDPQAHKRLRAAVDRAARKCGYAAAGATAGVASVAGLGVDGRWGAVAWSALFASWLVPAATWWRMDRHRERPRPAVDESVPVVDEGPRMDPAEAEVRRVWGTRIGMRQGDVIGQRSDGAPDVAAKDGRLPGTTLTGWRAVRGGWRAVIVGPAGVFEADDFLRARGKIAGAYRVSKAMVALVPSVEDENRCEVVVQEPGVIREQVRWSGPASIDIRTGTAPIARYVDGPHAMYEIWRPGWGCAHEIYVGSTGSGKTETLQMAFTIGRWAQHEGRGLVCDFLIDPQQGQSYSAYIDDLAAPVAQTADEALMLVRAFRREMLRRNAYLSQKTWTDSKGRSRRAVKWWDPLEDGPLLFLTIDEAHEYLAIREFAALVTAGARMYRKCGMRIRVATHTPLLSDLGGSMALRDMLTGGFVWCGKTNNGLTSATAFNGRLPADPRTIPDVPGAAYVLSPVEQRGMLARTMWEPDFYDYVRDELGDPVGYPGVLPAETLAAFGPEYQSWVRAAGSDGDVPTLWTPAPAEPVVADRSDEYVENVVLNALQTADVPLDMAGLDAAVREAGVDASVLALRQALGSLRGRGLAAMEGGRHVLDPRVRARFERECAEQLPAEDDDELTAA